MVPLYFRILRILCVFFLFTSFLSPPLWGFEKVIEGPGDIVGKVILLTKGGDMVITGSTSAPSFGMKDIYIAKFSPYGEVKWARHYGGFFDDWGEDLYLAKDGIYILGTTYSFGTGCSDIAIVRYTYHGKKNMMIPYGSTYCEMAKAFVKGDQGFIILGKEKDKDFSFLLFLDTTFHVKKKVDIQYLQYPEGILYKRGVGILVYGGTHAFDHDFKIGGYVALFSPEGEKIWDRVLGEETEYFLKDAVWGDYSVILGGFSGLSLYGFWSPLIVELNLAGDIEYEKVERLTDSSGILSLDYSSGKVYGGGFEEVNGALYPMLFEFDGKKFSRKRLSDMGEVLDLKVVKEKRYYTGYVIKGNKRALILGSY